MSGRSQSFVTNPKDSHIVVSEDEDVDEVPALRGQRRTESTCASPHLYRRDGSYISSFASVIYRDLSEDDSPLKLPSHFPASELHSETEIQRIKRESEEAKDQLKGLAKSMQARAEEVRSHSALSSWESKVKLDYLHRLCTRLDSLLADTHETEKMLTQMIQTDQIAKTARVLLTQPESKVSLQLRLRRNSDLTPQPECRLEGQDRTQFACCSFIRS